MKHQLAVSKTLYQEVLGHCQGNYPQQSRGIFATTSDRLMPVAFYPFQSNKERISPKSREFFGRFGPYYHDHKGFVADPMELIKLDSVMQAKRETMVGLFHVHIDFPAAPSRLDIQTFMMSVPNYSDIWYAILSFLSPDDPEFRVFWIRDGLAEEIRVCLHN